MSWLTPEAKEIPKKQPKVNNDIFFEKRHFFEEKVENGDVEVLFTINNRLAQKLH